NLHPEPPEASILSKPQIYEIGTDSIESRPSAHQPKTVLVASSLMAISLSCVGLPLAGSRRSNPPCPPQAIGSPITEFEKISPPGHSKTSTVPPFPVKGSRPTHKKPVARSASCWTGPASPSSEAQRNDVPTHSSASACSIQ